MERPTVEDRFVTRICKALDVTPKEFAAKTGVTLEEIEERLEIKEWQLGDADRDTVLQDISEYVNLRLGLLMAVRYTLQRTLQKDRTERLKRYERFKKYHGNSKKAKAKDDVHKDV